jgi:hypothetical protein
MCAQKKNQLYVVFEMTNYATFYENCKIEIKLILVIIAINLLLESEMQIKRKTKTARIPIIFE